LISSQKESIKAITDLFESFDDNKDGFLDKQEFSNMFRQLTDLKHQGRERSRDQFLSQFPSIGSGSVNGDYNYDIREGSNSCVSNHGRKRQLVIKPSNKN